MRPSNEKGGKKSMYKQSKRFLAGLLAFLLVVTMIPTDLLGVVYAAEAVETVEDDADVPGSTIADDDAEEAEVLENADADDDADAEEVLDENDIVKDGESVEPSEPASTTPEPSQPASDPQPSEPASTTPEPSEPASDPTPAAPNAPDATPAAGAVAVNTQVELTAAADAEIFYITDKTENAATKTAEEIAVEANKYTDKITIAEATTIYAVAKAGEQLSAIATFAYTIKQASEVNPVSLTLNLTDTTKFSNDMKGSKYDDTYFSIAGLNTIETKSGLTINTNKIGLATGTSKSLQGHNIGTATLNGNTNRLAVFTPSSNAKVTVGAFNTNSDLTRAVGYQVVTEGRKDSTLDGSMALNTRNTLMEYTFDAEKGKTYAIGSNNTIHIAYVVVEEEDYQAVTPIASSPSGEVLPGTKITFNAPGGVDIYWAEGENTPEIIDANKYVPGTTDITINAAKKITVLAKIGKSTSAPATYSYTLAAPLAVAPTANIVSGVYNEAQNVTFTSTTEGAKIYYTTDGTNPVDNQNALEATGAILVDKTQTIKAYAISDATQASPVVTLTYIIKTTATKTYTLVAANEEIKSVPENGGIVSLGNEGYFKFLDTAGKSIIAVMSEIKGTINKVPNQQNYVIENITGWPTEAGTLDASTKTLTLTGGTIGDDNKNAVIHALRIDVSAKAKVTLYHAAKLPDGSAIKVYKATKYDDKELGNEVEGIPTETSTNTAVKKAEFELPEAGVYYIGFSSQGGIIPYISVTENPSSAGESFTVKFYDGETELTDLAATVTDGTLDLSTITAPTKAGKVFKGWASTATATAPDATGTISVTADTNLYAVWADEVVVTLMNGATKVEEIKVAAGDTVDLSEYDVTPEAGKTFLGWATTENAQAPDATVVTVSENKTYYAVIVDSSSVKEYIVTRNYGYEENGTAKTDTFKVPYTDAAPAVTITLTELGTPRRDGFRFVKWTVGDPAQDVPETGYEITNDTAFTAVWEEITVPTEYTVTFKNGNETVDTKTVTEGESLNLSTVNFTVPTGKTLTGWNDGTKTYLPTDTLTVTGNMTLTAVLEDVQGKTYTVTLMNGDEKIADVTGIDGQMLDLSKYVPTVETGKVFLGWSTEKDATEAEYGNVIKKGFDDGTTLYAVIVNEADVMYTVTYWDYNEISTVEKIKPGTEITLPDPGTRSGYTFKYWYNDVDDKEYKAGDKYTVNSNVEFNQEWDDIEVPKTGMDVRVDDVYYEGGTAVLPGFSGESSLYVYYKGEELTYGVDYTVKGKNNKNAGTATLTVNGIGNYKGVKKDVSFKVLPRDIDDGNDYVSIPYEMTLIKDAKVAPVITCKGKQLKLGKDYTLKEGSNIDAKGKYTGSVTAAAELDEDGTVKKAAETRTMTVTGIGNFRGTKEIKIKVVDKANAKQLAIQIDKNFKPVIGDGTEYGYLFSGTPKKDAQGKDEIDKDGNTVYDASTKKIKVLDKKAKTELTEGTDFEVVYTDNMDFMAGTVKFTVVGIGEYSGNVSKSFKISPKKLEDSNIIAGVYNGWDSEKNAPVMEEKPEATYNSSKSGAMLYGLRVLYKYTETGTDGKETTNYQWLSEYDPIWKNGDYKVTYSANKKVGKAKATITFLGDYKGTKAKTVEFDVVGDKLSYLNAYAADMTYSAAGKSYVSKPIVEYNGTILKASEYTASYEWSSASDVTVNETTKEETRNWTKDDKVKVTLKDSDKYAMVRVTITPNAKKSNFKLATTTEIVDGKETEVNVPLTVSYNVTKADGALDLSKAKVEFYSKVTYNRETKTATYNEADKLKAVQFCDGNIWTPSVDDYEKDDVKKDDSAVYVKVTVNKTTVVDPSLYDVNWICSYNAGKATVVISGKVPESDPTTPANPADGGTSTGTEGTTSATTYAAGGKTVTVKIDPIKSWIEPTKVPEAVNNLLKKLF